MTALRSLCTRLIWLEGGRMTEAGDPSAIINHYLQNYIENNLESIWNDESTAPGN